MAELLKINGQRLWASLMEMAKIGATPKGGVCRLALTDLDRQGREQVIAWAREAGLTITIDRADLNQVMMGVSSFDDLIQAGKARFVGDRKAFDQLRGLMVAFTPNFEILPGTAPKAASAAPKPFEMPDALPPETAGD